jgi:very-short-patch-repair endonuclease
VGVDLEVALQKCGGAARWGRLRQLGVSGHVLRNAAELMVGRGAFALPDTAPALITAVRLGGIASHGTAAALHGFPSWRADPVVHITVVGQRPAEPDVRLHRARLDPSDVDPFRPMTAALRTALDCGRVMALPEALVVLDAALHSGKVRREPLRIAAETTRGHGATALRRAVAFSDELAESPLESVLRLIVTILDCEVRIQVRIRGVGKVDLLLNGWLVLEGDGFEFHSGRKAYREDRARGNALAERGYVLLRFTWEDVYLRPGWVLGQVARVLSLGPRN